MEISSSGNTRRHSIEEFICGLAVWMIATVPFSLIGMAQILIRTNDAPLSIFEMSFVAGGCCIAPLILLVNLCLAWRCFKAGSERLAFTLCCLAGVSFWAAQSGAY